MRLHEIISEGRIEDTFGTKSIDKHDRPEKKKKEKPVKEKAPSDAIWGIFADGKDIGARYTSWADAGEIADKLKKSDPKKNYEVKKASPEKMEEGEERQIIADRLVDDVEREFSDAKGQIKDHNRDTYEMNMYNYMSGVRVDDIVDPDMIHGGQRMGDFASGRVIDVIDPSSIIDRVIERLS